jgi:peptidoglycan/LPS O-acetylase OafA/YrhL
MISSLLLRTSVVLLLVGMIMGIVMGIQQNFQLAPAHAHLNLIGFVMMFLAGLYYRVVPEAAEGVLAKIQATLHIASAIVFPVGIAVVLTQGPKYELAPVVGALMVLTATVLFGIIVYRTTSVARTSLKPASQA